VGLAPTLPAPRPQSSEEDGDSGERGERRPIPVRDPNKNLDLPEELTPFGEIKAKFKKLREDPRFQLAVKVFGVLSAGLALGLAIASGAAVAVARAAVGFAITFSRHTGGLDAMFDKLGMSETQKKTAMLVLGLVMLGCGPGGSIAHIVSGAAHGAAAIAFVLDSGRLLGGLKGAYDTGNRKEPEKPRTPTAEEQQDANVAIDMLAEDLDEMLREVSVPALTALAEQGQQTAQLSDASHGQTV
jgi:hypothetical protein